MILEDITQDIVVQNRMVWRKMGNKVVPLFIFTSAGVKVELYLQRVEKAHPHENA